MKTENEDCKLQIANCKSDEPLTVRDSRVDQLGFVKLLVEQHGDVLRDRIKSTMALKGAAIAQGDHFAAQLVSGGTVQTVSAELWTRMWERGEITRQQFIDALSVNKAAALEAVGKARLAEISDHAPASPSLRVTKIKDAAPVRLLAALKGLAAVIRD